MSDFLSIVALTVALALFVKGCWHVMSCPRFEDREHPWTPWRSDTSDAGD